MGSFEKTDYYGQYTVIVFVGIVYQIVIFNVFFYFFLVSLLSRSAPESLGEETMLWSLPTAMFLTDTAV